VPGTNGQRHAGVGDVTCVLVIDDDMALRLLTRQALQGVGLSVEEAGDGQGGLEAFRATAPDIVLLDVMMPGLNGFQVCSAIRDTPEGEHVPVLIMTALEDVDSIDLAYDAGATDFITKPINWALLGHRVRYMLRANHARRALVASEARNRAYLGAIPDAILGYDAGGLLLDYRLGPADSSLDGLELCVGKRVDEIWPTDTANKIRHHIRRVLDSGELGTFEYQLVLADGRHDYEARMVVSEEDKVMSLVRDITERKRAEEKVRYLAFYDNLTDLPNRESFKDRLGQAIDDARSHGGALAVLLLDLDNFRRINDTLGHRLGDVLLERVALGLKGCVRSSDWVGRASADRRADLARMGGDEFALLIERIQEPQDAGKVATRILAVLARPIELEQHEVFVNGSLGISVYPNDGEHVDTLLKNADTAMYEAKEQGGGVYQFYANSMNASAHERLALESQLRRALQREEFLLHYQPQLDLGRDRIVAAEALVRWQSPEHGLVPPGKFIPIAEEFGLIDPIGWWVLRRACQQNKTWQEAGLAPIRISVNLSGVQFRRGGLVDAMRESLEACALSPEYLELELTESTIMRGGEETIATLKALKDMGLQLAIDDFGTGYSSLSYLKRFPIDTLKIDKSFVDGIPGDLNDTAIARAIINMAHSLGLSVVAEGVETQSQLDFLRQEGCDVVQGYHISRPGPADVITLKLEEEAAAAFPEEFSKGTR